MEFFQHKEHILNPFRLKRAFAFVLPLKSCENVWSWKVFRSLFPPLLFMFTWKALVFFGKETDVGVRMRQPERKTKKKSRAVEKVIHENVCHRDASRTACEHNNILRNTKTCSVRQKERMKEKEKIENASVDETEVFGSNWILANYGCSKEILCSFHQCTANLRCWSLVSVALP